MEITKLVLVKDKYDFSVELYTKGDFNARITHITYIGVYKRHCNGVWQFVVKNGGFVISIFAESFEFVDRTQ